MTLQVCLKHSRWQKDYYLNTIMKTSETITIKRSQIQFNPINPKHHLDRQVKLQEKNIKRVGFLGGVVWNRTTGNLVDGHRRIMALDALNKYDGSNDYDVKVEAVDMDKGTEKEQLTYMAVGNTKPDLSLVAEYIGDIDPIRYQDLGFCDSELRDILSFNNESPLIDEPFEDFISLDHADTEERKETVKSVKERVNEIAKDREQKENAFVTLSFGSYEAFCMFMDVMGASPEKRFVKGEDVLKLIQ